MVLSESKLKAQDELSTARQNTKRERSEDGLQHITITYYMYGTSLLAQDCH